MNNSELQKLDTDISRRISELETHLDNDTGPLEHKKAATLPSEPDADAERQITEMKKQELARLRTNLKWLGSENGGCCETCGCDIPVARLRAVPVTRLCVKCAR